MAYYSTHLGYDRLYSPVTNYKKDFVRHMYEVENYIPAHIGGISFKKELAIYMNRFIKSRNYKPIIKYLDFSNSYDNDIEVIKNLLYKGKPIAFLQMWNKAYPSTNYHWMTITKYFENNKSSYIVLSTWNKRVTYDFHIFHSNMTKTSFYGLGGIVYIDTIN